jgi:hypothetical protein
MAGSEIQCQIQTRQQGADNKDYQRELRGNDDLLYGARITDKEAVLEITLHSK